MTFEAIEEDIKDPYELEGKSRLEQAESMLKSIKDVDQLFRSSDNFREVKSGLEKLVEMARKYPNMNEDQFWAYQKQVNKVKGSANKYIRGKNKEEDDYAEKNKGEKLKRSEYTSKRMNAVSDLWEKLDCHLALTSGEFTKEYTGNERERAIAKYERLIRLESEHRQRILGRTNLKSSGELADIFDVTKEYASFLKSMYLEKMKHRFDTDPTFTPKQFLNSLISTEINDGIKKMSKEIDPDFRERIKQSIAERIQFDGEEAADYVTDDTYFYDIVDPDSPVLKKNPIGVGHDYVRFEYRMELIRLGQADESVFDKDDYIGGPKYEPDEWEIKKYNIIKPEKDQAEEKPEAEEEKKVDKKTEIKEPQKEDKKEEKKAEKKAPKKEEKKAPKKAENKNIIKEEKAPKKEEKKTEKKSGKDSLAAQIAEALTSDELYENSNDPLFRSIVSEIYAHAKKEKPGENTKIADETLVKMAKYVDKISDIKDLSEDDYIRRHLVESAYRQYRQKPEEFRKNCSTFIVKFPSEKDLNPTIFSSGNKFNPVKFYYRDLFHELQDNRIRKITADYAKMPENKDLEKSLMDEAYSVLMVNVVDLTLGNEKNGKVSKYNSALDSTEKSDQRERFINTELSSEFKEKFKENVLKNAKAGKLNAVFVIEACEDALAKMLHINKAKKSVRGEKNTRALIDKLKIKESRVNRKAEEMNKKQAIIMK